MFPPPFFPRFRHKRERRGFNIALEPRDAHARGIVALGRACVRACRAAGVAKPPRRTSINTGLSLVVWVLSGQGVSPGK